MVAPSGPLAIVNTLGGSVSEDSLTSRTAGDRQGENNNDQQFGDNTSTKGNNSLRLDFKNIFKTKNKNEK
jgi:hypothetical protein